ncbi:pyridoxal-phosphate dependent enzyme [Ruegeria marina]|uniref:Diaminopropionate ammonia-lyase n=1 Tax=Ruegeria marina TaxID=639004 RepID=A0A1G6LFQ1_9RHOB|nr:pyridoxal-phosphate dependent enzyme [Ruegeria marina]SDC42098.1 diaminopropionate ammonia-lyase [Ruegeria marina]
MKNADFPLDPAEPLRFLSVCPAYVATPLTRARIGGRDLWVKDESRRMGLGAFKALGGVYAVARLVARHLGCDEPAELITDAVRSRASDLTFVCASAGNHGMAVAAGARLFGARARIHLAATVPESFAARLRGKGAEVVRSGAVYDEAVAAAIADAETTGALHLADGSWPGYTEPPRLVMEGYTVIAGEMRDSFAANSNWPSHVYLQAGVGGLAAAIAGMIRRDWTVQPEIVVVEPDAAPCLKASVAAGRVVTVTGPESIMGRLDCKVPSMLAFDILRHTADRFVTVSDAAAAAAADKSVQAGHRTSPSGAAGLAALLAEDAPPANPLVILSEGAVAND